MKIKRLLPLLLAGVMFASVLTGCGEKEIDKEATVATVDGKEVSLGFANFVARYEQAKRDAYYVLYLGDKVWESDSDGDGVTMEDTTKDEIMEMIQSWMVLEQKAQEMKISLDDQMLQEISATAEQFMADNSAEAIAQLGATQEYVEEMLYYTVLQSEVKEAIEAEAKVTVTDAQAAQRTFSYIVLSGKGETGEDGLYTTYDEDKLAEVKTKAEADAKRAQEDFDAVAKEYESVDFTYSYSKGDQSLDAALVSAADSLKEGQVSGLIDAANGFYVIRLDSEYDKEASDKNKTSLIAKERQEHYEAVLKELMDAAEITVDEKLWEQVKFDTLFTIKGSESLTAE